MRILRVPALLGVGCAVALAGAGHVDRRGRRMSSALVNGDARARPGGDRRAPAHGRDRAVAAQSLALGIVAAGPRRGCSADTLVAAFLLATKALVLPVLLYVLIRRTPEAGPVAAAAGPVVRLASPARWRCALCSSCRRSASATPTPNTPRSRSCSSGSRSSSLRRPIFFQLLGLVVAENGLSLLAVSVPGGLSYVIEFGALFDLALIVTVAAAFAQRDPQRHAAPATPNCCGGCVTSVVRRTSRCSCPRSRSSGMVRRCSRARHARPTGWRSARRSRPRLRGWRSR